MSSHEVLAVGVPSIAPIRPPNQRLATGLRRCLRLSVLIAAVFVLAVTSSATAQYKCLPSCAADDSRLLVISAGPNFRTMSDPTLDLSFFVPAGTTSFEVGIFDGDAQAKSVDLSQHWDAGIAGPSDPSTLVDPDPFAVPVFQFTVLADPEGTVTGTQVVQGPFKGSSSLGPNELPDNEWFNVTITTGTEAQTTAGDFRYRLHVELVNPVGTQIANGFKVRTTEIAVIEPIAQPFGYVAQLASGGDILAVYPKSTLVPFNVDTSETTYDGSFDFFFEVDGGQNFVELWGGDFDRGNFDGTNNDTDDPNTPPPGFGPLWEPPWATIDTVAEGVSVGNFPSTGSPPDNTSGALFVRQPTIRWDMVTPINEVFGNENPSGNQEWERFRVSSVVDPTADYDTASSLPAGAYHMKIDGVDMANFNFILLPYRLLCVDENGDPCPPTKTTKYQIGDTVFNDFNGNGVQDPGEPGIAGVVVILLGVDGATPIDRTVTDVNGKYSFTVVPGQHTVQVSPGNFSLPTAGATLGDRVWLDANANGTDDGEPGLANVIVELYTLSGDFVAATRTDVNGYYLFQGLAAGPYRAQIVDFTVPTGLSLVTVGGASDPSSVHTLAANGTDLTVDFPYANLAAGTALVGDLVWSDSNGNGVRDPGEAGIGGVTLELQTLGGVRVTEARTRDGGSYHFVGVLPGSYLVKVTDTAEILAGYTQTYDKNGPLDGTGATAPLAAGGSDLALDFGYKKPSLPDITDAVWFDDNRNGLRDEALTGFANVTVNLVNSAGERVATTTTGANGIFTFPNVPDGTYTLELTDINGVLAGLLPTTPGSARKSHSVTVAGSSITGENFGWVDVPVLNGLVATTPNPQTNTVVDADVLTYDFGYWVDGACGVCDGKVRQLSLRYQGTTPNAWIMVLQKDGAKVFEGIVQPGEVFTFLGTDKKATLGTEIEIYVGGALNTKIHTSCSQPIGPGLVAGDFLVTAGASRNGGALCPLEDKPNCDDGSDSDSGSDSEDSNSDSNSDSSSSKYIGSSASTGTGGGSDSEDSDSDSNGGGDCPCKASGSDSDSNSDSNSDSGSSSSSSKYLGVGANTGTGGGSDSEDSDSESSDCDNDSDSEDSDSEDSDSEDPPPPPSCAACDGKVTTLTLKYQGSVAASIRVFDKNGMMVFEGTVAPNATFSFIGKDKNGTLGSEISIYIGGVLKTKIHTSCSKPIGPGQVWGDFLIVAGASRNGGALCPVTGGGSPPPPPPSCAACDGKVTTLTLKYQGKYNALITVKQKDGTVVFNALVAAGASFTITGVDKGTLGTEIEIFVNGTSKTKIHTSCSKPIGPGQVWGDFLITEGASKNGGALCPLNGSD